MSLKPLLKDQTINIDNHHWNGRTPLKWGKEIHLHKRMNRKGTNVEVLIYIADEKRSLEFRNSNKEVSVKEADIIKNEIKKAFKNKKIRKQFVEDFYKTLDSSLEAMQVHDEQKKINNMLNAARQFAQLFGIEVNNFAYLTHFKKYIPKDNNENKNKIKAKKYLFYDEKEKIYVRIDDDDPTSYIIGYDMDEVKKFD